MKRTTIFLVPAAVALAAGLASVQPLQAKEISLPFKGLSLNGNLELADGKALSDAVVLMVHGTMAHNRMEIMATLQDLLKERQINSLAITLGLNQSGRRGMNDCARPHTHKHTDALDEIGAWLDWLQGRGAGKVTLLGHSRGGNQAAWFAAAGGQDALAGLVLVAPGSWTGDSQAVRYQERFGIDLPNLMAGARALIQSGRGGETFEVAGFLGCSDATVSAAAFVSYYGDGRYSDLLSALKAIEKPVLVIAGSEDTVVPGLSEKLKGMESETLRLFVIEDAGHFFRDLYAEDLADLIEEFMGEQ